MIEKKPKPKPSRHAVARKPVPPVPKFEWPGPVTIFSVEFATTLLRDGRQTDPNPSSLASRLNEAIENAIGWAREAEGTPKPTDLQNGLAALAADCQGLLSRMGLDSHGAPPDTIPVQITRKQPWFQWLRSGLYGLLGDVNSPEADLRLPARRALTQAIVFAEAVVPHAIGHEAVDRHSAIRDEVGADLDDAEQEVSYATTMIEAAIERAAPVLALMSLLAEGAATRPRHGPTKDSFDRSFLRSLFIGLANVWFATFGRKPSGVDSTRQPGGPAFDWYRAVLAEAHDKSGPLAEDVQSLLHSATELADATLTDRISDGVGRSSFIATAQGPNRDN